MSHCVPMYSLRPTTPILSTSSSFCGLFCPSQSTVYIMCITRSASSYLVPPNHVLNHLRIILCILISSLHLGHPNHVPNNLWIILCIPISSLHLVRLIHVSIPDEPLFLHPTIQLISSASQPCSESSADYHFYLNLQFTSCASQPRDNPL